ncbi:MAG: amidohydrolase family protein [Acidobacteriota bacterium]|nr:amidohydrolase family protein [Acidobacteriota bacterium]
MNRRIFLGSVAAGAVHKCSAVPPSKIIDTHTHFYDPARSQGVPWPTKSDEILYRTVLPDEYRRMTKPLGVTGTIVVEASPLLEDNQWILDLAAKHPVVVGFVGHLDPGKPPFRDNLDRLRKNRLFLGIRLSSSSLKDPNAEYISNLKAMADAGLELDLIGGAPVLEQTLRLSDRIPNLRIVIDHLPFDPPADEASLRELQNRPQVYAKVSNVVRRVENRVPDDMNYYRASLDELWNVFGADRLVYGSNWPVSDHVAPYATLLKVVREYFAEKGPEASEKYFWKNSKVAYRWPGLPSGT